MLQQNIKNRKVSLILDSGAFSAWMKQTEIDIDAYIEFCLDNLQHIDFIVNLDVIPGKFGQKNVPKNIVEKAANQGWKNYKYLLDKGLPKDKIIHVFHQGEDFKWLKLMTKELNYIGLSPANDRTTLEKINWLDNCMPYVTNSLGIPIVKFHGFAVTSLRIMLRYPWYSSDSTSWVLTSRFGSVYVPRIKRGKYIYNENSWKICVSNKSPSNKEAGKHITTFSKEEQKIIESYFKDKGYTLGRSRFFKKSKNYKLKENEKWFSKVDNDGMREVERIIEFGLSNDYRKRDELNIIYFLDLEKSMPKWPWPFKLKRAKGFGL